VVTERRDVDCSRAAGTSEPPDTFDVELACIPRSRIVEEEDCEARRGREEGIKDESRGDGGPDEMGDGLL
jgi:hypothetical protein